MRFGFRLGHPASYQRPLRRARGAVRPRRERSSASAAGGTARRQASSCSGVEHGAQWARCAEGEKEAGRYTRAGAKGCPVGCGVRCTVLLGLQLVDPAHLVHHTYRAPPRLAGVHLPAEAIVQPGRQLVHRSACVCMHMCTDLCVHAHVLVHRSVCVYMPMCTGLCVHAHVLVHRSACVYMHMQMSMRMRMSICVCVCMCMCMYTRHAACVHMHMHMPPPPPSLHVHVHVHTPRGRCRGRTR